MLPRITEVLSKISFFPVFFVRPKKEKPVIDENINEEKQREAQFRQLTDKYYPPLLRISHAKDDERDILVSELLDACLGKEQEAVEFLLDFIETTGRKSKVREEIMNFLRELGKNSSLPFLVRCVKNENNSSEFRRWAAINIITKEDSFKAIPELLSILKNRNDNPSIREYIARVLGEIGDIEIIEELQGFQSGPHSEVNQAVSSGIERIYEKILH